MRRGRWSWRVGLPVEPWASAASVQVKGLRKKGNLSPGDKRLACLLALGRPLRVKERKWADGVEGGWPASVREGPHATDLEARQVPWDPGSVRIGAFRTPRKRA